jgi:glycosyltransferase involved in cell wall biosynthesis
MKYVCPVCHGVSAHPGKCVCGMANKISYFEKELSLNKFNEKADLNIISLLLHSCGYSVALEQLCLGLDDMGYKLNIISHEDKKIDFRWMSKRFKRLVKTRYSQTDKTIIFTPPIFMRKNHKIGTTYAYTMFETDRISDEDVQSLSIFDKVIVTCEHNIKAFRNSGVSLPIETAYLSIDFDFWDKPKIKHEGFVFFSHGSHSVRKGTDLMEMAFVKAFPKNKNVKLIIKDTPAGLAKYKLQSKDQRIIRIVDNVSPEELRDMILSSDCGLFPSRGEGWGMGAMEFMASGLPVILTDYAGLGEMCNSKYNYPLNVKIMAESIGYYGKMTSKTTNIGKWAEPDLDHLIKLMKEIYNNQDKANKKGNLAKKWIRKTFNRESQAIKIISILGLDTTKQLLFIKNPLR